MRKPKKAPRKLAPSDVLNIDGDHFLVVAATPALTADDKLALVGCLGQLMYADAYKNRLADVLTSWETHIYTLIGLCQSAPEALNHLAGFLAPHLLQDTDHAHTMPIIRSLLAAGGLDQREKLACRLLFSTSNRGQLLVPHLTQLGCYTPSAYVLLRKETTRLESLQGAFRRKVYQQAQSWQHRLGNSTTAALTGYALASQWEGSTAELLEVVAGIATPC